VVSNAFFSFLCLLLNSYSDICAIMCAITVAKSKLDPKHSVNNRIKKLEDNLTQLQDLVNSHRQALDAIPARIKKIIPPDMNSQLARLSTMMDNFETLQSGISASASRDVEVIS
jgi:small-conductance mechanosensitive channel